MLCDDILALGWSEWSSYQVLPAFTLQSWVLVGQSQGQAKTAMKERLKPATNDLASDWQHSNSAQSRNQSISLEGSFPGRKHFLLFWELQFTFGISDLTSLTPLL